MSGAFDDIPSVVKAFEGAYGAWVNTDGFTVGEVKETYYGMRIYEIAKQTKSMRHYVWSNLDYALKVSHILSDDRGYLQDSQLGNYDQQYRCEHYDGE